MAAREGDFCRAFHVIGKMHSRIDLFLKTGETNHETMAGRLEICKLCIIT